MSTCHKMIKYDTYDNGDELWGCPHCDFSYKVTPQEVGPPKVFDKQGIREKGVCHVFGYEFTPDDLSLTFGVK